mmetsp:Transcript_5634/g.19879  ORF Transcript_5634/g.19879 Transcript_5634/m.19879 type:complete len:117 (+) Transcript_5634:2195-2545(+)
MRCGVCIAPSTPCSQVLELVSMGCVDVVNLLAVEPGFGGQKFQVSVKEKIQQLRSFIDEHRIPDLEIMVDGGINTQTARLCLEAGASSLVAGSFVFNHKLGVLQALEEIRASAGVE